MTVVALTCMLTVPILIPVLTDLPLPQSDMGDIVDSGLILTMGSSGCAYGGIGSSRGTPGGVDIDHAKARGDMSIKERNFFSMNQVEQLLRFLIVDDKFDFHDLRPR